MARKPTTYDRAEAALDYTPRSLDEILDVLADEGEPPRYACENGHLFTKPMRRYADVYCPICGTTEVARNAEG